MLWQVGQVLPEARVKNIYGMTEIGAVTRSDTLGNPPLRVSNSFSFFIDHLKRKLFTGQPRPFPVSRDYLLLYQHSDVVVVLVLYFLHYSSLESENFTWCTRQSCPSVSGGRMRVLRLAKNSKPKMPQLCCFADIAFRDKIRGGGQNCKWLKGKRDERLLRIERWLKPEHVGTPLKEVKISIIDPRNKHRAISAWIANQK